MPDSGVPFFDLQASQPLAELTAAVQTVLASGRFVGGPEVESFEREFAEFTGARECVGVSSGTSALQAALLACGVGPGDEVITSAATFVATVAAIVHTGATPVFVDIDVRTRTLCPDRLADAVTPRTRAVIPVDLYGHPADADAIRRVADRFGLAVVADAAQAHGAVYRGRRVGTLADATCFSFYPSKNLGALGDAGAVTTDAPHIAARIRQMRDHGRGSSRDSYAVAGHNWRLDAVQAAALRVKLRYLEEWVGARRTIAGWYGRELDGCGVLLPRSSADVEHAYHLFVVQHGERDVLREALAAAGIATQVHYPRAVHQLGPFARYAPREPGCLGGAEQLARECLSLPLYPGMTPAQVRRVGEAVLEALPA
ncbi:DegT/DnrJ/EryC1/StrS family aminotransferase [Streptomyces sp. NPDC020983]|uniref:DegT/DnrJ/EryC1/StrS family aminotransferase n=1 Tax=Streptomyces sp. NPDC020983 TaxID=3365106 RepID=UPI00379666AF